MKLGIFLKFVLFFVLLAIVLGAGGLYVYKKYRQGHYEAVASAQLAVLPMISRQKTRRKRN